MSAADDFSLTIGWFGELDKPRYEAVLASSSRASAVEDDAFVAVAPISRAELDAAVAALRARGLSLRHGAAPDDLDAYAAVADVAGGIAHASLGFDEATVGHLEAIAEALEPAHRAALDNVLRQVRGFVAAG